MPLGQREAWIARSLRQTGHSSDRSPEMRDVPDPLIAFAPPGRTIENILEGCFDIPAALMGFVALRSPSWLRVLRHFCPSNPLAVFQTSASVF